MSKEPDDPNDKDLLGWLGISSSPDFNRATALGRLIGFVLILIIGSALLVALLVLFDTARNVFTAQPDGPNLGAGALITALLGSPFLIWATIIKHRSLGFQKEGHLTDRISKAVEQLGAEKTVKKDGKEETKPNIEVRIGGILSLERIAQDSTEYDKGRDHVRVMEILCAYIRQNAPASEAKDHEFGDWEPLEDGATKDQREAHGEARKVRFSRGQIRGWAQGLEGPRADIAIALRVIGRRSKAQRQAEARWGKDAAPDAEWVFDEACPALPEATEAALSIEELEAFRAKLAAWKERIDAYRGYRLDLRKTNLQRADLSDLCLAGAFLTEVRMEGADLEQVRMQRAYLSQARMEGADLSQARIEAADLSQARMEGADLSEAHMVGTILFGARMEAAILRQARMEGANLWQARMEAADLWQARMDGASLVLARMPGANLWSARMVRVELSHARMEGAELSYAHLEGANLKLARMEGADLSKARLDGANLRMSRLYETTELGQAVLAGARVRLVDCSKSNITPEQLHACFGDGSTILSEEAARNRPSHWPKGILNFADFETEWRKWLASPDTYSPPAP